MAEDPSHPDAGLISTSLKSGLALPCRRTPMPRYNPTQVKQWGLHWEPGQRLVSPTPLNRRCLILDMYMDGELRHAQFIARCR